MSTVSVNEIERNPGAYLARARAGEVVLITDNDLPVAELKGLSISAQDANTDPVGQFLCSRIADATVPAPWKEEGVADPSVECRNLGLSIALGLYADYELIPHRVSASKQGGVFLAYKRSDGMRSLGVEIGNDLDAVGVVSNDTDVLADGAFEGEGAAELLAAFRG